MQITRYDSVQLWLMRVLLICYATPLRRSMRQLTQRTKPFLYSNTDNV